MLFWVQIQNGDKITNVFKIFHIHQPLRPSASKFVLHISILLFIPPECIANFIFSFIFVLVEPEFASYADGSLPALARPRLTHRVVRVVDDENMSVQSGITGESFRTQQSRQTSASFGVAPGADYWSYSQHGTPASSRPASVRGTPTHSRPITPELGRRPEDLNRILSQNEELSRRLAEVEAVAAAAQAQLPHVLRLSTRAGQRDEFIQAYPVDSSSAVVASAQYPLYRSP